ncbi:sigma-70 family RNA polymerase sigma factor [Granulicella sp. dw_53]|uniref:sigma-70 family RNA polymerase sigma factor n=1 Tax=Granulicella sp. dw_53 TaxID=2719792 RepID=UPI001BD49A99|nr:sigma-70 family RNA polymerase sigma factor [Granulicella sp. dw_53]
MSCEYYDLVQANTTSIEHIHGLYSYAMVLTRNHAEAEDLVQETYVRAIPAMAKLRDESNIKAWLFKILRNVWLNQLRKRRTGPQMVQTDMEDGSTVDIVDTGKDSYDIYVSRMEEKQVRAAIEKLPTEFREIILLREFENLSYHDIASLLDCPAGTVMSRLARARSRLRVLLSSIVTRSESCRGEVRNEGLR